MKKKIQNKYEFISEILERKKLTPTQKERFLKLTSLEIKNEDDKDQEILARIKTIEEKLNINGEYSDSEVIAVFGSEKTTKGDVAKNNPNPKHVADFMSLFNQRDGFKYLTHDYDEDGLFDMEAFLLTVKSLFYKKTKELNISPGLFRIFEEFALKKEPEWKSIGETYENEKQIRSGWSTPDWKQWSLINKLHPFRNDELKEVINDFKRITRIAPPQLEILVNTTIKSVFKEDVSKFEIKKEDLSKADFYTHVAFLKIAFELIFEEIINRSDTPNKRKFSVQYKRETSGEYFVRKIIITHYNSYPNKELKLLLKEWQEKGNMGKIKQRLKGYCHWSVETLIEGKSYRLNILKEKETPEYEEISSSDGFTHVLTFYYK